MLALQTVEKTEITLKGSVEIVSDFFFTAINSILYQRGKWRLPITDSHTA
jgi:mitotic spindle assembly checkpoint protein MAD2